MKVTIIGGSGFIGTRIVDHFTQFKGYDFHIVDIRDSHFFNDITTIGDVRNQQQMDSALAGTDLVILLAAQHRDNVYNLLHQIQSRHFLMVGNGRNRKSMAYVGNIVAFVKFLIDNYASGYNVFNYIDKPDYDMNQLVQHVETVLQKRLPAIRIPYAIGMAGGYCLDALAWLLRRKFAISAVRVKKFCATTEYDATRMQQTGFKPPYTLADGLARTLEFEFIHPRGDKITYETE